MLAATIAAMALTSQQFAVAVALVKPRCWRAMSMPVLSYVAASTLHDRENIIDVQVSAETIAMRTGQPAERVRLEMLRLHQSLQVLDRESRGQKSGAMADVWSIPEPVIWKVEWSLGRQEALALVAGVGFTMPMGEVKGGVFTSCLGGAKSAPVQSIPRLQSFQRGPFLPHPRTGQEPPADTPTQEGVSDLASPSAIPSSKKSSTSTSKSRQQERSATNVTGGCDNDVPSAGAMAVIDALERATGHRPYDGKHPWRRRFVEATPGRSVEDVRYVIDELFAKRPAMWSDAFQLAWDRLRTGPAEPLDQIRPATTSRDTVGRRLSAIRNEIERMLAAGYDPDWLGDEYAEMQTLEAQLTAWDHDNATAQEGA